MKRLPMCAESMAAILAGKKDLTTRVVVPQPHPEGQTVWAYPPNQDFQFFTEADLREFLVERAPFHPGDPVAFTETWRAEKANSLPLCVRVIYRDGQSSDMVRCDNWTGKQVANMGRWHPAFLMPAAFARRFGTILSTASGRLWDMTDADYLREGVPTLPWYRGDLLAAWIEWWDKLDAGRGYPHESNPWTFHYGYEETHGIRPDHS